MPSSTRKGNLGRLVGMSMVILPVFLGFAGMRGSGKDREVDKSIEQGHELSDLPVRGVVLFFVGVIVMGAVALAITTTLLVLSSKQGGITFNFPPLGLANAPQPALPPEPRLENVPGADFKQLLKTQDDLLNAYGWVDQKNGRVHIPIDRAIDLLLQQGLPARPPSGTQYEDSGDQVPSSSSSGRMMEKFP